MSRINAINPAEATGKARQLLDAVQTKLGKVPNMMSTMAVSPAVLEAYLGFSGTVAGTLDARERELISLAVSEANGCEYCAAAHSTIGKMVGLTPDAILDARRGTSSNPRHRAIVEFATAVSNTRGQVTDQQIAAARNAGITDAQIAEIVANVALNAFTNYFNNVAKTTVDWPAVEPIHATA